MNSRLLIVLVIAGGCIAGGAVLLKHHKPVGAGPVAVVPTASREQARVDLPGNTPSLPEAAAGSPGPSPERSTSPLAPGEVRVMPPKEREFAPPVRPARASRRAAAAAARPEPAVEPPMAREALSLVGLDETAEAVWAESINDPSVPAEARKNLIEDLNEDGFPDPDHVTADDVPLILNRLQMIEQYAPDAMDEVNAAAFEEAYKDLAEMLVKATGE